MCEKLYAYHLLGYIFKQVVGVPQRGNCFSKRIVIYHKTCQNITKHVKIIGSYSKSPIKNS